jgi:hypothetical protein
VGHSGWKLGWSEEMGAGLGFARGGGRGVVSCLGIRRRRGFVCWLVVVGSPGRIAGAGRCCSRLPRIEENDAQTSEVFPISGYDG